MEVDNRFLAETIRSVFESVTEQLTGIKVDPPPTRKKRIHNPLSVVVLSKGTFKSKAIMCFPSKFEEAVVDKMNDGTPLSLEDMDAYFKEYLNIIFGRFISEVNNAVGRSSRFVIPVLLRGVYKESGVVPYKNSVDVSFMSKEGPISISVNYEVLPEHSSN